MVCKFFGKTSFPYQVILRPPLSSTEGTRRLARHCGPRFPLVAPWSAASASRPGFCGGLPSGVGHSLGRGGPGGGALVVLCSQILLRRSFKFGDQLSSSA